MNLFAFTGNLGRDCEIRSTASGTTICNFAVAVTSGYGDNKTTSWINCALFGKRAEGGLVQYLKKGTQVAVSGELTVRTYDKKDGSKGTSVEVRVGEIDLIGGKGNAAPQTPAAAPPAASQAPQQQAEAFDDDLPF